MESDVFSLALNALQRPLVVEQDHGKAIHVLDQSTAVHRAEPFHLRLVARHPARAVEGQGVEANRDAVLPFKTIDEYVELEEADRPYDGYRAAQ